MGGGDYRAPATVNMKNKSRFFHKIFPFLNVDHYVNKTKIKKITHPENSAHQTKHIYGLYYFVSDTFLKLRKGKLAMKKKFIKGNCLIIGSSRKPFLFPAKTIK